MFDIYLALHMAYSTHAELKKVSSISWEAYIKVEAKDKSCNI